jgi:6-phosphofructokinase
MIMAEKSIVILCGGGPAPGINTVISSITKVFNRAGYRVLGLDGGYSTLFCDSPSFRVLDFDFADEIYSRGGSALKMSRYKPKNEEFRTDFFVNENIKLLVTIGGDDTASTANRITKFLTEHDVAIQNIHVPKTIDNDLPLPEGIPTFGYQSAKAEGVIIASTVYEDARTSRNWFIISAMGREAGHLAFGIGTACHYPMIVIPEMFDKTKITFDKIVRLVISSIIKRKILGIPYGAAIISEGVFHFVDEEEIKSTGINFTYDDHGHPELGNVSKAHIFNILVQKKVKELKLDIKSRPVELGYEIRCCKPIAYDLVYCTNLGIGVKKLFDKGESGCMVSLSNEGKISPLYLKDVEDEHGKVKPRLVNINIEKAQMVFHNSLHFIGEEDYEAAKQFLPDPENYDFYKILNW